MVGKKRRGRKPGTTLDKISKKLNTGNGPQLTDPHQTESIMDLAANSTYKAQKKNKPNFNDKNPGLLQNEAYGIHQPMN